MHLIKDENGNVMPHSHEHTHDQGMTTDMTTVTITVMHAATATAVIPAARIQENAEMKPWRF